MSAGLFWAVIFPISYVLIGVGVSRAVYARAYAKVYPDKLRTWGKSSAHEMTVNDDAVFGPALFSVPFWPGFAAWFLLIAPIGTVVWPLAVKWYTAPARKAVSG